MMISRLRHGLSYNNQILGGINMCQVSLSSAVALSSEDGEKGGSTPPRSYLVESQKSPANPGGTIVL